MPAIVSLGYFLRDLIIMTIALLVVLTILKLMGKAKEMLSYRAFKVGILTALLSFLLIITAQVIGILINTTILFHRYEDWQVIRSILLTVAAILLFVTVLLFYLPFGRGEYMVVRIATEPSLEKSWGAYWGEREKCYGVFKRLLELRLPGIAVSRDPPEVFRRKLGLKITPVIWISKVEHEEAVSPTRLEYLIEYLKNFLTKAELDKVVLIDCIDYLILENGERAVFKFLTTLKDLAALNRGIVLVTIDKDTLSERAFSFLTNELRPISELKVEEPEAFYSEGSKGEA
ncbi:DUF835 domain-containing protein [Pyrococcus yayanosii]|nr:DUF835 domain-containing protein [Pyrococcus yayanosii]